MNAKPSEPDLKGRMKMKVTLTNPKELVIFHKLIGDMTTCNMCGHTQDMNNIPADIHCFIQEQQLGYVEVVCPKCGNVQVLLPVYDAFPSAVSAFSKRGADKDPISSKLNPGAVDDLRNELLGASANHKAKEELDEKKKKLRNLF